MATNMMLQDLIGCKLLEITVDVENKVWINVDGVCRFRCRRANTVKVEDCSKSPPDQYVLERELDPRELHES